MNDKYILITGASSGIGKSVAIRLSFDGYKCILIGRNKSRLEDIFKMLNGSGHKYFCGDLNDQIFVEDISNCVPELSGVVHSAGIIKLMPVKFINKIDFTKIIETNLLSPFFLTQQLIKRKKLLQPSSIVFMSSISGSIVGSKGNLMYSASKSALNGMIKTLALELSNLKIRINSVSAGMVLTEMWEDGKRGVTTDQLKQDEKKYPFGYGTPKDIASIISFLISDDSSWITGSTIVADGGFTIQ